MRENANQPDELPTGNAGIIASSATRYVAGGDGMEPAMVNLYCFSPCGTTEANAKSLIKGMGEEGDVIDLLNPEVVQNDPADVSVVAFPVYNGHVPPVVFDRLDVALPDGGKAIGIAAYGNRAFENALNEMEEYLRAKGFEVTALVGAIGQHSLCEKIGTGRPDTSDAEVLFGFGEQIARKLADGGGSGFEFPRMPDVEAYSLAISPITSDDCIACGICADECPTQVIVIDEIAESPEHCLGCGRCIKVCPVDARMYAEEVAAMYEQFLTGVATERQEPELYL